MFIPALTGLDAPGDLERELFAMPARYGGLGLVNPVSIAEIEHQTSVRFMAHLVAAIILRETEKSARDQISPWELRREKRKHLDAISEELQHRLPEASSGVSSWLEKKELPAGSQHCH